MDKLDAIFVAVGEQAGRFWCLEGAPCRVLGVNINMGTARHAGWFWPAGPHQPAGPVGMLAALCSWHADCAVLRPHSMLRRRRPDRGHRRLRQGAQAKHQNHRRGAHGQGSLGCCAAPHAGSGAPHDALSSAAPLLRLSAAPSCSARPRNHEAACLCRRPAGCTQCPALRREQDRRQPGPRSRQHAPRPAQPPTHPPTRSPSCTLPRRCQRDGAVAGARREGHSEQGGRLCGCGPRGSAWDQPHAARTCRDELCPLPGGRCIGSPAGATRAPALPHATRGGPNGAPPCRHALPAFSPSRLLQRPRYALATPSQRPRPRACRNAWSLVGPSLPADGVAVKYVGAETFRLCRDLVDGVVLVDNAATSAAIKARRAGAGVRVGRAEIGVRMGGSGGGLRRAPLGVSAASSTPRRGAGNPCFSGAPGACGRPPPARSPPCRRTCSTH